MPKLWIIGDHHFDHFNIIKICNRPFSTVDEMNEYLIEQHNRVVSKNDICWFVGDFTLGRNFERIKYLVGRLNGRKFLLMGNHDTLSRQKYLDAGFEWVYDKPVIMGGGFVILSHEPIFLNENTPFYNYFAHVHNDMKYLTETPQSMCVSAERTGYAPVRLNLDWRPFKNKKKGEIK